MTVDEIRVSGKRGMGASRWVVAVAAVGLLTGCGKPSSSQAELTMWLVGSEAQAKTINELSEAFTQQSGVRVRCEAISWGEAHSKYLTAVAGGVQPDIGTMGLTWGAEFGQLGALLDLRQRFPDDVSAVQQQTFPGMWASVEQNNTVYGIPFDLTLQVLYYRNDIINQTPATWNELLALLERLHQEDRRMVIDWGNLSWIGYAPFLWQAGGDFYNEDHTKATLTTPQAIQALEFFRDLYVKAQVPRTAIPLEQGLRTGEFPLALSGNWKVISLTMGVPEIEGKWAVGMLPKGPGGSRTAFLGGRTLGIFSNTRFPEESWKFINYLFRPEVQVKLYEAALQTQDAYLPPNIATWDSLPMEAGLKSVLKEQAQDAKGPPAVPGWNESTRVIESAIQRVILHGADVQAELAEANEVMDRALQSAAVEAGKIP